VKLSRALILLPVLVFALVVAGCGGGSADVPTGAVAVVNGTNISRTDLDGWIDQAKKGYAARKQEFPKVGTPEYQQIQTQYVAFLVQRAQWQQAADELGIKVTKKDIDKALRDYIREKFGGSRQKFEQALEARDFPESLFRQTLLMTVLSQKLYEHVTKDVKVPQAELLASYREKYSAPSREVRHILVAKKKADGQVDYPKSKALADRLHRQLKDGADFAALAKKYSGDPGSAAQGGKFTASEGREVPEYDKVAFALKNGELSEPVQSTYGYFIIQALKSPKRTPFSKVKATIETTLLQEKKQQAMYEWIQNLNEKYKSKISYATGFAPPDIPDLSSTSTQ
jgi:parvulin-like peptidyl-prolyl isomerase